PNIPRALMVSFALGLGAGVGMAFLLELLDDRVRAPDEIEQLSGLPTLGVIPHTEVDTQQALKDPQSVVAEAYRSMAIALQFSTGSGLPRSISVTSSGPGEGKSTTSIAIAQFFAQMGLRVLLVDADLRKPSLHTKLHLRNSVGLSNYLTGSATPPDVLQTTAHPNCQWRAESPQI
ncbi:MAG: AAA family ATPase, partial [Methylocystis sp.]